MAYKIGIDFGTTNTVISYIKDGEPEEFKYTNDGNYAIPSVISKDKKYIGEAAMEEDYVKAMKMFLPLDDEERRVNDWNGDDTPEEYIKIFFSRLLKKDHPDSFENRIGEIEEIILCVPHVWSNEVSHVGREKLKKIFSDLGFRVSRIVSEPIAAAAFFVNWHKKKFKDDFRGKLLVCDMGGGTFDVTLCEVKETGKIESKKNEGNGTTLTGKGFAGVYFDETLIRRTYSRIHNKEINKEDYSAIYIQLQAIKSRNSVKVPSFFELAMMSPSEVEREKTTIYKWPPHAFIYKDVVASFEKIGEEIRSVLNKVYTPGDSIDAYFLTGGFNQFYLCKKEIVDFFSNNNYNGKVFDSGVDTSIAGKSISFGAALVANGLVNIDEKYPHSFGFISYKKIRNEQGGERFQQEYNCLIKGGKNLNNYQNYSFSKDTYAIPDPKNFKAEFYVEINSDKLQRHEFQFSNFFVPNPDRPGNRWSVGLRIDASQIVHVAFKDTSGATTEYQLNDILKYQGKLISE